METRAGLDDPQTLGTGCWQGQQSLLLEASSVFSFSSPHNFPKLLAPNFSPMSEEEQTQNVLGQHLRASAHNRV